MTITCLLRIPDVGEVGKPTVFLAAGTTVGDEGRWYLAKAPVSSALSTLATVVTADRQKARLVVDNGKATFTPDVAGHYEVEHHDVTIVRTYRTYSDAPTIPDTDDDFAGAPVVTLDTAEGRSRYRGQPDYQVIQTATRLVGVAPNTIAIALRSRDVVESVLPDCATFTPANTPLAKLAQYNDSILGVRDLLLEGRIRDNVRVNGQSVLQATLYQDLSDAILRWNDHVSQNATCNIHIASDSTNTVPYTACVTLADCLTRLAALRTAYNAHRVSVVFHIGVDNNNAFKAALANPTDLVTALNFARIAFQVMVFGSAESTFLENDSASPVYGHMMVGNHSNTGIQDPLGASSFDFSSSLAGLVRATNRLTELYNLHRSRVSQTAAHSGLDTDNKAAYRTTPTSTVPELATLVNGWAAAIARHTSDLDGLGVKRMSPYHQNTKPIAIGQTASDLTTVISTFELCCAALETHALDGGDGNAAHVSYVWGKTTGATGFGPWSAMTRLQLYMRRIQQGTIAVPSGFNVLPTELTGLGWKLQQRRLAARRHIRLPVRCRETRRVEGLAEARGERLVLFVLLRHHAERCRLHAVAGELQRRILGGHRGARRARRGLSARRVVALAGEWAEDVGAERKSG